MRKTSLLLIAVLILNLVIYLGSPLDLIHPVRADDQPPSQHYNVTTVLDPLYHGGGLVYMSGDPSSSSPTSVTKSWSGTVSNIYVGGQPATAYRGIAEFDLGWLPFNVSIQEVYLKFSCTQDAALGYAQINRMYYYTSVQSWSNAALWAASTNGTTYLDPFDPSVSVNQTVELNNQAALDLQYKANNGYETFALGFSAPNLENYMAQHFLTLAGEGGEPNPQLVVIWQSYKSGASDGVNIWYNINPDGDPDDGGNEWTGVLGGFNSFPDYNNNQTFSAQNASNPNDSFYGYTFWEYDTGSGGSGYSYKWMELADATDDFEVEWDIGFYIDDLPSSAGAVDKQVFIANYQPDQTNGIYLGYNVSSTTEWKWYLALNELGNATCEAELTTVPVALDPEEDTWYFIFMRIKDEYLSDDAVTEYRQQTFDIWINKTKIDLATDIFTSTKYSLPIAQDQETKYWNFGSLGSQGGAFAGDRFCYHWDYTIIRGQGDSDGFPETPAQTEPSADAPVTNPVQPIIIGSADALPLRWYFRGDTHTVQGVLSYKIDEVMSATLRNITHLTTGTSNTSYGVRVWLIDSINQTVELTGGSPEAVVTRTTNGTSLYSVNWNCPDMDQYLVDSVRIWIYHRWNQTGSWTLRSMYSTDAQLLIRLPEATWTFYYYLNRTNGSPTNSTIFWGTLSYMTGVNISYVAANPWDTMMYWLWKREFMNFLVTPWTFHIGSLFYGMLVLLASVTTYNRYGTLKAVLGIMWLFGGAGGLLNLVLPAAGLGLAYILLAITAALTFFKLFF